MVVCYSSRRKLIHKCNGKNSIFPSCAGKNPVLSYHVFLSCESPWLHKQHFIFDTSGHQICGGFPTPTTISRIGCPRIELKLWHYLPRGGSAPQDYSPTPHEVPVENPGCPCVADQPVIDPRFQQLFFCIQSACSGKHFQFIKWYDKEYGWTCSWRRGIGQGLREGAWSVRALSRCATLPAPHAFTSTEVLCTIAMSWRPTHISMIDY